MDKQKELFVEPRVETLILVDDLVPWETKVDGPAARWFGNGKMSCHMMVAGDIEQLHKFAARIGLFRRYYQEKSSWPHYDLTPNRRANAIALGAIQIDSKRLAAIRREVRNRIREKYTMFDAGTQVEQSLFMRKFDEASKMMREYFDDYGALLEPDITKLHEHWKAQHGKT